jgi:carboxylesterase type B
MTENMIVCETAHGKVRSVRIDRVNVFKGIPYAGRVSGAPAWPAYTLTERASMRIDTRCETMRDRHAAELALWRTLGRL